MRTGKHFFSMAIGCCLTLQTIAQIPFSTNRQIYNFDVGDVFHYHLTRVSTPCFVGELFRTDTILNKSLQGDSVIYSVHRKTATKTVIGQCNINFAYQNYEDTITLKYNRLDSLVRGSLIVDHYKILDTFSYSSYNDSSIFLNSNFNNRKSNSFFKQLLYDSRVELTDGLGMTKGRFFNETLSENDNLDLIYYHKIASGEIGGTPALLNLGIEDNKFSADLNIYPNPANSQLTLSFSKDNALATSKGISVAFYNLLGEKILEEPFQQEMKVDLSQWVKGLYFVRLSKGNEFLGSQKIRIE